FLVERPTGKGEGVIHPRLAALVGFEAHDAGAPPLLTPLRERHRELAPLEPYLRAVVCLNDPWNLQGADLVFTGRLVVRPPHRASHARAGERSISSTHQYCHLVSRCSKLNRSLVVQAEGEGQF